MVKITIFKTNNLFHAHPFSKQRTDIAISSKCVFRFISTTQNGLL